MGPEATNEKGGRSAALVFAWAILALAAPSAAAPPACEWLDASLVGGQALLLWMPAPGAERYRVYLDGERVAEVEDYWYTAPAPAREGVYRFEVAPVDSAGAEGPLSPASRVSVVAFPASPPDLYGRPEFLGPKVRLRWGAVRGAARYNLYRGIGPAGPLVLHETLSNCEFVDVKLKVGRKLRYAVAAVDQEGREGERSEPVSVTVPVPGPC